MDRVTPGPTVDEPPHFQAARILFGRGSESSRVGGVPLAAICLDDPRILVGLFLFELKSSMQRAGQLLLRRPIQGNHLLPTSDVERRVHTLIHLGVFLDLEFEEAANHRVTIDPLVRNAIEIDVLSFGCVGATGDIRQGNGHIRHLPILMLQHIDQVELGTGLEFAEVDHDVVAFGDSQCRQFTIFEIHRVLHDIPIVRDHVKGHGCANFIDQGHLEVARNRSIQKPEAITPGPNLEIGLIEPIHRHGVADEPLLVEGIECQLPGRIPSLFGQQKIHIVIAVAPIQGCSAGQPQIHAIIDSLVAAIKRAVVVHHRCVALVYILRRIVEHVIVVPMRAHGFPPIARNPLDTALAIRPTRPPILCFFVDRIVTRQSDGPAIVVELTGKEESIGIAITLRRVVAIMLMGGQRVNSKARVLGDIDGECVVLPHQHRLAVSHLEQFGRERSVKSPNSARLLLRHGGMKSNRNARSGPVETLFAQRIVVEAISSELAIGIAMILKGISQPAVDPSSRGRGLVIDLGLELFPALMRPALTRRSTFSRGTIQGAAEPGLDLGLPGIRILLIRKFTGQGPDRLA